MKRITLIQKFSILYITALIVFAIIFGWIVGIVEERGMLKRSKLITSEIVSANVQKHFRPAELLTPKTGSEYESFSKKMKYLIIGPNIERIKIWNKDKTVVWADERRLVGKLFPDNEELEKAIGGEIVSKNIITDKSEHKFEKQFERLHELYVPIRFGAHGEIESVFEIYQNLNPLYMEISFHKKIVWTSTFLGFTVLYLMLFGIIWSASRRIEAQTRKIFQSEEKYRTLVQSAQDGIISMVRSGEVILCNEAAARMFGYAEGEVISQPISILMPEKYRAKHQAGMLRFFKTRKMTHEGKAVELEGLRKDGKVFPMELSLSVSGETDSPTVTAILRDISERKMAEEERNKLADQLRQTQKIESIGTLAGGIAHDFNNILYPIIGYAEMTMEDVADNHLAIKNLEEIFKAANRAKDLVQQILTFSRESGQDHKPLKVQSIIKEALKLLRASIPSTIEISRNINNDCEYVMGDSTQVHQVIMNLCTNAFHAMEDEGGKLEVTLKEVELGADDLTDPSMTQGPYVCLTVTDTGIGMEQAVLDRIFDPYYTTKDKDKGTGLGLAVVHGIVKKYGGDIKVYSEPGKGTAFHVHLPVIRTEAETKEVDTRVPVQKGTERILLVDDEETIVSMETQMLERLGYDVTERTSSIEALEAFRASPDKFDLVITDMTMPNMTGVQLSQKLLEIRSDIPIIICTGFSTKIDGEKAKAFGIRGYVMKPVVMSEIAKKIRAVLDQE